MARSSFASSVFMNGPFDDTYGPILNVLVFTVFDCGFEPRCAMEIGDGAQIRIDMIFNIINEFKYSIHDISRTELDPDTNFPRVNMPLELRMFLGARRFWCEATQREVLPNYGLRAFSLSGVPFGYQWAGY